MVVYVQHDPCCSSPSSELLLLVWRTVLHVMQGAQQQLQRIELLVSIQQYDNARMQLRQGSFKSLRSDLRYESEYRGVQPEVGCELTGMRRVAPWLVQPRDHLRP